MRNDLEHQEQCALIQWCELHKTKYPELDMIFAIPNAGGFSGGFKSNAVRVLRLKESGVKKGVPDLFLSVPAVIEERYHEKVLHGLYIEMKVGRNKPTDVQLEWFKNLRDRDYQVALCYSWTEAVQAIIDYLGLPERIRNQE